MIIVPSRKAIVLKAANPEQLMACIPTAKKFMHKGVPLVYVPHELDETKVLRNLGGAVPSPIQYYYNFPFKDARPPFTHQKQTSDFLTIHRRCAVLNQMRCVDADTEYLSENGWARIADYKEGKVAQYNADTKELEFVTPEAYHVTPCVEMVHFTTRSIDQMFSLGHRVVLRHPNGSERVVSAYELYEAMVDGRYDPNKGGAPVTFNPPVREGLPLTSAQLRLMVAVIADGHFSSATRRVVIRLKRERKIQRLRMLLQEAQLEWKEWNTAQGYCVFSFYAPRREKDFSGWWVCDAAQLRVVTEEVLHWDGNRTTGRDRFSSYVKSSAEFVQYAFAACGYSTSLKSRTRTRRGREEVEYVVQVHKNATGFMAYGHRRTAHKNAEIVPAPGGKMYCFTVPSTFLVFRRNGHIFVSGNTGKTLSCIWTADYLMRMGLVRKVLVVAPLSTLDFTWTQSIFDATPSRKSVVLHGSRDKRLKLLKQPTNYFIVNHDGFKIIADHLPDDIDLVIYDEAAVLRNPSTSRYKEFSKYIFSRPEMRLWLLTGTPTPNEPTDAWSLCKLIGAAVPRYTAFREIVMRKVGMYKWVPREGAAEIVSNYLQPSILFRRDDCFDLPSLSYESRSCELSVEQAKMFKDLVRKLAAETQGQQITAVNEAAKIQKLLQVLLGVVYTDDSSSVKVDCAARINVIREIIEEYGEGKALVFVPFTGALEAIADELSNGLTVEKVYGATRPSERLRIFNNFTDKHNPQVIVADARTMAHGIDLSASSIIIWAGPTNSNETYEQACARILGPKQTRKTTVFHIEATDIERRIFRRLKERQSLQGILLDLIQAKT